MPPDCRTAQSVWSRIDVTQAARRFVARRIHEQALQANQQRVERTPRMMEVRRRTIEHPFGAIKHQTLGNARLLMRGKRGARSEFGLGVLACDLGRTFDMMGADWMQQALKG